MAIAGPIFFRQVAHAAGSSPSATAASPFFLTPPIHNHVEQAFHADFSLERLSCKMRPPASSPLGDLRRHRFLRTRTSCSSGWRVVPARIPARGGRYLVRVHNSAPHSPVLCTREMQCFVHPTSDSLFPRRGIRSSLGTSCRRTDSRNRARVFAPVTVAAFSVRPRSSAPRRRLNVALRLCSAGRSTSLNG